MQKPNDERIAVHRIRPESFLDINELAEVSRYYTTNQLYAMLVNLEIVIQKRLTRRQCILEDSIGTVIEKDLMNMFKNGELKTKFPSICDINSVYFYSHQILENYRNPTLETPYIYAGYRIYIYFRYGEKLRCKQYDDDIEEHNFDNLYKIEIKFRNGIDSKYSQKISLKIIPPSHHVSDPPYNKKERYEYLIQKSASVKYVIDRSLLVSKDVSHKMYERKSKHNTKTLTDIYGTILKEVVKFYIEQRNMVYLMEKCIELEKRYYRSNIIGAKASVLVFLLIGRFRKDCVGNLNYDVIQYIAKIIWSSRYDNAVWGIGDHHISHLLKDPDEDKQRFFWQEDDITKEREYNPGGWEPFYHIKNNPQSVYKLICFKNDPNSF